MDKCGKGEYNRFRFGVGSLYRRCLDWLDWMLVEAWNCEHNQLHHYYLSEDDDPDLVEENLRLTLTLTLSLALTLTLSLTLTLTLTLSLALTRTLTPRPSPPA